MTSLKTAIAGLAALATLHVTATAQVVAASSALGPAGVFEPFEFAIPTAATAPGGLHEASASPHNPWLDYRFRARLVSPSGRYSEVPGFYAADGRGGDAGSVWKVRITPDEIGRWGFVVAFEHGSRLNVRDRSVRGTSVFPDGYPLFFDVGPARGSATGFHRRGPLEVVGERYLRHRDGTPFLKTGTNSPENLLAYAGFDGARDLGGLPRSRFLHRYASHIADWRGGDPDWASGTDPHAGRGIIGAINYLADSGVNSLYAILMNLGGDGQDVFPFIDPTTNAFDSVTHFDVGRLEQWNRVFEHAQRRGVMCEFVLAEIEQANVTWLGVGMTDQRRLFLTTMVAHFGHHPGVRWILCEENGPEPGGAFTTAQLSEIGNEIRRGSRFGHPIAVHTLPNDLLIFQQVLAGPSDSSWLSSASLQARSNYNPYLEATHAVFEGAGRTAIVDMDELGPVGTGVSDTNHDHVRKLVLWDSLLSGGGVAWYCGGVALPLGGDLDLEDFRTRDGMWRYSRIARELMQTMPFTRMRALDDLVVGDTLDPVYGDAEVFGLPGEAYVICFGVATATGTLDLGAESSQIRFAARWFDPRTGGHVGSAFTLAGGVVHALPAAPAPASEDWVLVLRRI